MAGTWKANAIGGVSSSIERDQETGAFMFSRTQSWELFGIRPEEFILTGPFPAMGSAHPTWSIYTKNGMKLLFYN